MSDPAEDLGDFMQGIGRLRIANPGAVAVSRAKDVSRMARSTAAKLRALADCYEQDGQPGDLGTVWGWRTIAEHLRKVADEIEQEE